MNGLESLSDLTPEWLTAALRRAYPGVVVATVQTGKITPGTATKAHIRVAYEEDPLDGSLPVALVIKGNFELVHQIPTEDGSVIETRFYSWLASCMDGDVPRCHFAIEDGSRSVVGLEDLEASGGDLGSAAGTLTSTSISQVLAILARFHAHSWQNDDRSLRLLFPKPGTQYGIRIAFLEETNWRRCSRLPRFLHLPQGLCRNALVDGLRRLRQIPGSSECLIHGDVHVNNVYFRASGRAGLLDWQTVTWGCWAEDVAYFLIGSLEPDDRRAAERELIGEYLHQLAENGVDPPPLDQAIELYSCHALPGLLWALCPPEMQAEDTCIAMTTRFAAAVVDFGLMNGLLR